MPKPLLNRIHADVAKVSILPPERKVGEADDILVVSKSPDEFNALLSRGKEKWRQVVVENNITVQ